MKSSFVLWGKSILHLMFGRVALVNYSPVLSIQSDEQSVSW